MEKLGKSQINAYEIVTLFCQLRIFLICKIILWQILSQLAKALHSHHNHRFAEQNQLASLY